MCTTRDKAYQDYNNYVEELEDSGTEAKEFLAKVSTTHRTKWPRRCRCMAQTAVAIDQMTEMMATQKTAWLVVVYISIQFR